MGLPAILATVFGVEAATPAAEAEVRRLLAARTYPAHEAVLAFEARFGGTYGEDDEPLTVGAGACLGGDAHADPRGGRDDLVPVIYTANDGIGYLDGEGRGWFQDTIEEADASLVAPDGAALVCRVVLWNLLFAGERRELPGLRGAELAERLGVPAVVEASDAKERWWSDGTLTIRESDGLTTVCGPEDVVAAIDG
jgi:hypothetical protein